MLRTITLICLLVSFLSGPLAARPVAAAEELITYHLTHAGHDRTYHVHVPPGYDPGQPLPLIILLDREGHLRAA